jgi:GTPase
MNSLDLMVAMVFNILILQVNLKQKKKIIFEFIKGGNGGHIIIKADNSLKSLNKIKTFYCAEDGGDGRPYHMRGKNAKHLTLNVPVGTILKDENGDSIADLSLNDTIFIAARGGAGGKGNHYYLTNDNRKPQQVLS